MSSDVLDYVREKDPRFKEVSDDELTLYVAQRKPDFLKDKEFAAQYDRVVTKQKIAALPKIQLSPYEQARMAGQEPVAGPFGPAHPEEVLALPELFKVPAAVIEKSGVVDALEQAGADFLQRTRINPAAQPGVSLPPKREEETFIPSPVEEAFPEVTKGIEEALRGFVTPGTVLAAPGLGAKVVQTGFKIQMAAGIPDSIQELARARTPKDISKAGTALVAQILPLLHGIGREKPAVEEPAAEPIKTAADAVRPVAPATAAALDKQAEVGKGTSAIQREAKEVLQPVQPQPRKGKGEVPAERAGPEISARGEQALPQKEQELADYQRYQQLIEQVKGKSLDEAMPLATEMEEIKNRYGGKPPPKPQAAAAEPPKPVGPPVEPEKITAAAYQDVEGVGEEGGGTYGAQTYQGANHPEILNYLGIKGFETRESRNTPQFGFTTNKREFVSREEAGRIATAAGQNLETFEPGEPVHSDQIESPEKPGTPIGDVPKPVELVKPAPAAEPALTEAAEPTEPIAVPSKVGVLIDQLAADKSGRTSPKRTKLYQQLGNEVVPGIRLADAEEAGRLFEMVRKGEATQAEFDKWVTDAKASGRVAGEKLETPTTQAEPAKSIEQHLTVPKIDATEARERVKAVDKYQADLREQARAIDQQIKDLEKVIKPQRGSKYERSRIKKSAKKADVTKYNELTKQWRDLGDQIAALDESAKADRALIDAAMDVEIINDPKQPLARRLDRRLRQIGAPRILEPALKAETDRLIKEAYPDATLEEMNQMRPEIQRMIYFGDTIRPGVNAPDLFKMRRDALHAAINGLSVPKHLFPEELKEKINRFSAADRPFGSSAKLENLSAKDLADLKNEIADTSRKIHEEQAAATKRAEEERKAEEAKTEELIKQAEEVAASAVRSGKKGGRSPKEVRADLVERIRGAMADLVNNSNIELKTGEDGSIVAQGDGGVSIGEIEQTKNGFKVDIRKLGGSEDTISATVPTREEAEMLIKAMAAGGSGKVIIGVPGDGVFKLQKWGPNLLKLWADARRIETGPGGGAVAVSRSGGVEAPPEKIKTGEDWQEAKDYHGLRPDDKIWEFSKALREVARKVNDADPENVTTKDVDDWIKAKEEAASKKAKPAEPAAPAPEAPAEEKPKMQGMGAALGGEAGEFPEPRQAAVAGAQVEQAAHQDRPMGILSNVGSALRGGWQAVRTFAKGAAGDTLPRITAAAREAGEAGARYLSSRVAAIPNADVFIARVLQDTNVDPVKFGAALTEDNLQSIRQSLREAAEEQRSKGNDEAADELDAKAQNVATIIGARGSPFGTEDAFFDYIEDPMTRRALDQHKQLWQEVIDPQYKEAREIDPDVELSSRGLNTGARINLKAVTGEEGERPAKPVTGSSGLTATFKRRTPFSFRAKGTGLTYDLHYQEIIRNTFSKQLEIANKNVFDKALVESGNAIISEPAQQVAMPDGEGTIAFPLTRKVYVGPQFTGSLSRNIYVRKSLAGEYERAAGIGKRAQIPVLSPVMNVLNQAVLYGLTEGTVHVSNLATALFDRPVSGKLLHDTLLSATGRADIPVTITKVVLKAMQDNREQLAELATIGALRPNVMFRGPIGQVLHATDRIVRLMLDDTYKSLVRERLADDTETARREYVNQVGQYNKRAQGPLIKLLRDTGFGPFATAGRTFNVLGVKMATMSPGVPATSPLAAAALRVNVLSKWIGTAVLLGLGNYLLTRDKGGGVMGRPGTQIGNLDLGVDDKTGKHLSLPVANLIGVGRGLRVTGVKGAIDAYRLGLSNADALDAASRDIMNSWVAPAMGPPAKFATIAATGYPPAVRVGRVSEVAPPGESQTVANLKEAVIEINPIINTWQKVREGKTISEIVGSQVPRFAPTPGKTEAMIEDYPRIVKAAQANEFINYIVHETRRKAAEEKLDYATEQIDRLPDEFKRKAWNELRQRRVFAQ